MCLEGQLFGGLMVPQTSVVEHLSTVRQCAEHLGWMTWNVAMTGECYICFIGIMLNSYNFSIFECMHGWFCRGWRRVNYKDRRDYPIEEGGFVHNIGIKREDVL